MSADLSRTPRSVLVSDRSSFRDEKNRLSSQVEQLHLNYKVSVLLPECSSAPAHLDTVFNSFNSFYLIRKLPVYELLDKHFLESAVYQGSVYGLSYRTRIDEDSCVALTPNGHLSLSLDKDAFELLGVEGKPSRFNHRTNCRYVVSVDLTDSSMAPGGRGYQRLLTGLRSRLQLKTDFLLSHHPDQINFICTVQSHKGKNTCNRCQSVIMTSVVQTMSCEVFQVGKTRSMFDILGHVEIRCGCRHKLSVVLLDTSLVCPEPNTTLSRALRVSVCGLLIPQDIHRLIQQIRGYLEQPRLASWVSLTVHGFADSPVSWGGNEHGVLRGGENFYSLLMFHDHTYHLHLATGAHDTCPP
ncbi:Ribonuclease P protein subunit p40 [Collichthys lucidus]|uniref:Ribonuclease P protein subunit p40 n=1 Tax=Collichthys lucidus TaxID=240159 RepID=A0A4U5UWK3_COLLU|nr:Ribonuclease P protein subunit p40 [Collichthys lucidus]